MTGHQVNLATINKMIHKSKGSIFLLLNLKFRLGALHLLLNVKYWAVYDQRIKALLDL